MVTIPMPPVSRFICVRGWFGGFGRKNDCISAFLACGFGDGLIRHRYLCGLLLQFPEIFIHKFVSRDANQQAADGPPAKPPMTAKPPM